MLETIREYAAEQLVSHAEEPALRRAHAAYFLALTEDARPAPESDRKQEESLAQLNAELDNVRAALAWLAASGDTEALLRMAGALAWFWYVRGFWSEGRGWLNRAAYPRQCAGVSPAVRALALGYGGWLAREQGEYQEASARLEESLALFDAIGDVARSAQMLAYLGVVAEKQGDDERAAVLYEEALARHRALNQRGGIAMTLINLGDTAYRRGDLARSAEFTAEALPLCRELGADVHIALALGNAGQLALAQGEPDRAQALHEEGLARSVRIGDKLGIADALAGLAAVNAADGRAEQAARLLGAIRALCVAVGAPTVPHHAQLARAERLARERLSETAFAAAWHAGHALALEDAIAEAQAQA